MWCERPLLATVVAIFTPAFLVSSTTLMCDVLMLAFWIWALVLWERALAKRAKPVAIRREREYWRVLAVLTKYSAMTLLPLLPILSILRTRKLGWWLLGLAVPLLMLAGYELITARMYGKGLFFAAVTLCSNSPYRVPRRMESEWNHRSGLCRRQPAAVAVLCAVAVATAGVVGRWRRNSRRIATDISVCGNNLGLNVHGS